MNSRRAALIACMLLLVQTAQAQELVISEFVAVNEGGLQDEDHDSPDWIEVHNPNATDVNLEGHGLTDEPNKRRKWRFPSVTLRGGEFLIVFASGKNRRDPDKPLHTNFELAASGEYLALTSPDGGTVLAQFPHKEATAFNYPAQRAHRSYGRDARRHPGFFYPPTPGAANGTAYAGLVDDVVFSVPRGFPRKQFLLTLTTATPGATVRYTLDGSTPTAASGSVYTESIPVVSTTILRAVASLPEHVSSDVLTHTYVFLDDIKRSGALSSTITQNRDYAPKLAQAFTSLPSISIVAKRRTNGEQEVAASMEMLFPDGRKGVYAPCGIKEFGGGYTHFHKKNFRLYFRSRYGASKLRYPVFEDDGREYPATTEFDQLSLRSGSHDMMMRGFYLANRFTDDTMLDMGHLAPHGRFVHLYFNGLYWGQYHLRERWGASMLSQYLGGKQEHYEAINGNLNVGGWAKTGPNEVYDGDGSAWAKLKALAVSNHPSKYEAVKPYLDAPQLVDYMLLSMFGNAEREFRAAGVAGPGSGFKFFLNDADGFISDYQANRPRTVFASNTPGVFGRDHADGPGGLFGLLFKAGHPDFRMLIADRIQRHFFHDGALTPARNLERLQTLIAQIEFSMIAEIARWGTAGQTHRTPDRWRAVANRAVQMWLPNRTSWMLNQFRAAGFYPPLDAPVMGQHGGAVDEGARLTLSGAAGRIYFTTDGSDPRLTGGSLNPKARLYEDGRTAEILVSKGATWKFFDGDVRAGHRWRTMPFDDRRWSSGGAEFGYGDNDERTRLSYGPYRQRKHTTSYFRHVFTVPDTSTIHTAVIDLKRDDGAVVYLNGVEVVRSNLNAGKVQFGTFANNAHDDGKAFHPYSIPARLLKKGRNLLAVEVHQSSYSSSDMSFDLQLSMTVRDQKLVPTTLTLAHDTHLRARSRQGENWSALNDAFFTVGKSTGIAPGDVNVTELHYNPANGAKTEFIELTNVSTHAVNMRGTTFTKGIRFAFPKQRDILLAPNERIVLVEDRYAMDQAYGVGLPIAGQYSGNLDNGGERIVLLASGGHAKLIDFTYNDRKPWPEGADGSGPSLVLTEPQSDLSDPARWQASKTGGGTPGN